MPAAALAGGADPARGVARAPLAARDLLIELGDLKRIRSAGRSGSTAERLFREAWAALTGGADPSLVMEAITAKTLAAARLGDLDREALAVLGLAPDEALATLRASLAEVAGPIDAALRARLSDALCAELPSGPLPAFVDLLATQPRAGVTCPGRPRIMLEPPENHAEHCLMVAVYGVVIAPAYGADPTRVFLAGLAHHLHNALMPDSGFTGEMLLGDHLGPVMERATAHSLAQLDPGLRRTVEDARAVLPDAETAEGEAFHAADVIDRVLQIAQHLKAATLTMDTVLGDMELVHDGPVKGFHDRVLAEMRLP
ncbi:MAG TPA: HD domain-containing protein [Beijerinckiaceae bacterium]|jgi:5'-deoxynucleotidase YfbR-like HD superfamily hydrolase